MSDEYTDENGQVRVVGCSRCGESRVAWMVRDRGGRLKKFDGEYMCTLCRGNQLMERMIEKLDRQWDFWTKREIFQDRFTK